MTISDWRIERANDRDARRLRAGGTVAHTRDTIAQVAPEIENRLALVQDKKEAIRKVYQEHVDRWDTVDSEPPERPTVRPEAGLATRLRLGAFGAVVLESAMAAALMAFFTTLPPVVAVVVGVASALCLTFVAEAISVAMVALALQTPRTARRRLLVCVFVLTAVDAALLLPLLLARAGNSWATSMFAVSSALIALVSPALSGFLLGAAHLCDWSRRAANEYERAEAQERVLLRLKSECERGSDATSPQKSGSALRTVVAVMLLAAALPADAQRVDYFFDATKSPNAQQVASVASAFLAQAATAAARAGVRVFGVTAFTNDALAAPSRDVAWPARDTINCGRAVHDEVGAIIAAVRQKQIDSAAAICASRRASYDRRLSVAVNDAARELRGAVDSVRAVRRGACTSINDLLRRLAMTPKGDVALAVSDGVESCGTKLDAVDVPRGRAILVMVAANDDRQQGQAFARRRAALMHVAPWLEVILPFQAARVFER